MLQLSLHDNIHVLYMHWLWTFMQRKAFLGPQIIFREKQKRDPVSRSNSSESEEVFDIHRAGFAL